MTRAMKCAAIGALVASLAGGNAAWAEGYDAGGTARGTSEVTTMPVDEGRMAMALTTTYDSVEGNDDSNPLAGMRGDCSGTVLQDAEAVEGSGFCVFKGDGEDAALIRWMTDGRDASGAMTGEWELRGGTGKFKNGTGGGTYSSMTDQGTGATENTITGNIDLP